MFHNYQFPLNPAAIRSTHHDPARRSIRLLFIVISLFRCFSNAFLLPSNAPSRSFVMSAADSGGIEGELVVVEHNPPPADD